MGGETYRERMEGLVGTGERCRKRPGGGLFSWCKREDGQERVRACGLVAANMKMAEFPGLETGCNRCGP